MISTVPAYISEFRVLLNLLLSRSATDSRVEIESSAIVALLNGVPKDLHQRLRDKMLDQPSIGIQALCDFALGMDLVYHYKPDPPARPEPSSSTQAILLARNRAEQASTAMEIDHLGVKINALERALHRITGVRRGKSFSPSSTPRPPRLSPQEREHLRSINACFRCRRPGHMKSECRAFLNSFAADAPTSQTTPFPASSSGNASGV
ncbi:hypothetical protein BGW41_008290 [Actinomortierella wolfii]|nr:hypothetical protein BGW41_008290 [Actinomortierella wolfii]